MNNLNEQTGELSSGGGDPSLVTMLAEEEEQIETMINEMQDALEADQPPTDGEQVEIGNHISAMHNLPQDFGGVQSSEYAKRLARSQIETHILMSFSKSEVSKWSASLHQLETRGADPQAIDLIHPSLHHH